MESTINKTEKRFFSCYNPDYKEHLIDLYEQYKVLGTLEKVAQLYGITRERVRQLLFDGSQQNFFKYTTRQEYRREQIKDITKGRLLAVIGEYKSLNKVMKQLGICRNLLNKLLLVYNIDMDTYSNLKKEAYKKDIVIMYTDLVKKLGYHPSSTELFRNHRNILLRINRIWGNIKNYRQDQKIPWVKKEVHIISTAKRFYHLKRLIQIIDFCKSQKQAINKDILIKSNIVTAKQAYTDLKLLVKKAVLLFDRETFGYSLQHQNIALIMDEYTSIAKELVHCPYILNQGINNGNKVQK